MPRISLLCLQVVVNFQAWRWLFFFAFTVPIYLICRGIMKCLVLILESNFIDTKQMLYYLIGIKVSLCALQMPQAVTPANSIF